MKKLIDAILELFNSIFNNQPDPILLSSVINIPDDEPKEETEKMELPPVKTNIVTSLKAKVLPKSTTPWMDIAKEELGVSEVNSPERVIEYHKATTLPKSEHSEKTAWCASFASWVLYKAGYDSPHNSWAKSFLSYGESLDKPRYGCLVIYQRGRDAGHVHFYIEETESGILGIGGNQGDQVCEQWQPKANVLGYRWPVTKKSKTA